MKPESLAILMSHHTQFDGPLFSRIARERVINLTVYYLERNDSATRKDPELGFAPDWGPTVSGNYRLYTVPAGFASRLLFLWQECFSGRKHSLVIVPGYAYPTIMLLALLSRGQKLGMRLDTAGIYPTPAWKDWIKRFLLKPLFRRFSTFHPVGSLTEEYLRGLGVPPASMFRFPYAVDNDYLAREAEMFRKHRESWQRELNIDPTAFVVLGIVKFIPRENPMELLRGFALFHKRMSGSVLVLVGAGPLMSEIEDYVKGANLADAVHLPGYSRYCDLPKWYACSDVFVHPGLCECWGVSVNEAMACGLPVVTSDRVGSSYDLVREGVNGYRYPSGDWQALSNCLENVAGQPDRGRRMGDCSRWIVADWDHEGSIASLVRALTKVSGDTC